MSEEKKALLVRIEKQRRVLEAAGKLREKEENTENTTEETETEE